MGQGKRIKGPGDSGTLNVHLSQGLVWGEKGVNQTDVLPLHRRSRGNSNWDWGSSPDTLPVSSSVVLSW